MRHDIPSMIVLALSSASRLLAAACNDTTPAAGVVWSDCSSTYGAGFGCANLSVPVDWSSPAGDQITLGMNRYSSNLTSSKPKRHLFVNYGGPGAIGTRILPLSLRGFSDEILSSFDLVAVDPRGIGTSTPLQCNVSIWNERIPLFPETEADFDKLLAHNKALGESCLELSGNLFYHVDTENVARDLEAVRVALGGAALDFLGLSYGTLLGYQYAKLFPENIRTLVLDADIDHSLSDISFLAGEASTYEDQFDRFAEWAATSNESALYGQDVATLFEQLVANASVSPLPVGSGLGHFDNVTAQEILLGFQEQLVSVDPGLGPGWAAITQGLALASQGNFTALATLAGSATEGDIEGNSQLFAGVAVSCADWTHNATSVTDLLYRKQLMQNLAPHTKGYSQTSAVQSQCIGWPAPISNPPEYAVVNITTPALLIQSHHDPECSYTWAVGLQAQMPGSVLLSRDGDGHTSYLNGGEAAAVANAYFVNLTLPAPGTVVQS